MNASLLLSWREGVSASPADEGGIRVEGPGTRILLRPVPAVVEALLRLVPPGEDEERLADLVLASGPQALAGWYYALKVLAGRGLVCRSVWSSQRRLATLVSASPSFAMAERTGSPARRYLLSRFAYLRRDGDTLVLESPLASARVVLHDCRVAALIAALAASSTVQTLVDRVGDIPADAVPLLLDLLAAAGILDDADADDAIIEGGPLHSSRETWEFHDLLFHARSRRGRSDAPAGATYRLAGRMELPPPAKPVPHGEFYRLFRPDLEKLQAEDPPLSWVQGHRRSIREYGPRPVSVRQLGEFLYRVARIQDEQGVVIQTPRGPMPMAIAARPYPSGGALYELEFYAAIAKCDGLDSGLYYYEPRGHGLIRIDGPSTDLRGLIRDAAESAGMPEDTVQVLLILSARVPRISWKYQSISYALVLKHVGVVFQTMYLTATAMGLAPCALGCGDSDAFGRAIGADYYGETSVGEFLLGSRRDPDGPPAPEIPTGPSDRAGVVERPTSP
ncbi:MAG: SagB family peptide dehydrogenase [Isosphaeraceae bacterium]